MNSNLPGFQLLATIILLACSLAALAEGLPDSSATRHINLYREPVQPLTAPEGLDVNKVQLGEKLFNEPRLSRDNTLACTSCHLIQENGANPLPVGIGRDGQKLEVNTPTVFNSALNARQFWDGRASSLEEQVNFVVINPKEFASSWEEISQKLKHDKDYVDEFNKLYPEGITGKNIRDAIASYEKSLVTTDAPFDRYLKGETDAISPQARKGYQLFKNLGCVACHQGANVGGNLFMRLGIFGDYFKDRGNLTSADLGRFNVTGNPEDRYVFKVPSLRLASYTAPYFHDGSVNTLSDAIRIMVKYQLGRSIETEDVDAIKAFIHSLAGRYRGRAITAPAITNPAKKK